MKYIKLEFFEKHLRASLPHHFSTLYFLFLEDPDERLFLAKQIASKLGFRAVCCEDVTFIEEMETSLFSEKRVLICDEPKQKEIPKVDDTILIFTGKKAPLFYKKMEKEGTTLDLSGEKPWDRKKRLQRWLIEWVEGQGKRLGVEEALVLVEAFSSNFARLLQEVEKGITYSGSERSLTLQMLENVSLLTPALNGWHLSEALVLGKPVDFNEKEIDLSTLIGQLRYQFHLGLEIALGKRRLDLSNKKIETFKQRGLPFAFFLEGLKELVHLEIKMRSNLCNASVLFDQFRAHLERKREKILEVFSMDVPKQVS